MDFFDFFEKSHYFNVIILKLFLCVSRLEKRKISWKKFENQSILANFSHILWILITFLKKLVDGAPVTYFKFDVFWIYMLWGIQNQ
jgi:hypothetical protein